MARTICEDVFGKKWKELGPEEQKLFGRFNRKASYYKQHEDNKRRQREGKQNVKKLVLVGAGMEAKCVRCPYDRSLAALDFHHRDPTQKSFAVLTGTHTLEERIAEAKKCDLLCANCHRELHEAEEVPVDTGRPQGPPDPLFEKFLQAQLAQDHRHHPK